MSQITSDQAQALVKKHGTKAAAAKAAGLAYTTFCDLLRRGSGVAQAPARPVQASVGVSASDFIGRFDLAGKLRQTIKRLCRTSFVPDAQIRTESGISPSAFRTVAEQPEFKACQIKDDGIIWWSTAENVRTAREQAKKWGIQK